MTLEERRSKEQEIIVLRSELTSTVSDIGDWKLIKSMELEKLGKESPYDMDDYFARRQEVRDKINVYKKN